MTFTKLLWRQKMVIKSEVLRLKKQGMLNHEIMQKFNLSYIELRNILDGGDDNEQRTN